MEVQGTVYRVGEVKQFGDKGFKKREVIIKTDGDYPQYIPLEITKDKADTFNSKEGELITATIDLRGRLWNNPQGEEKCFASIECWKWESNNKGMSPNDKFEGAKTPAQPVGELATPEANDTDDLPF